MRKKMVAAVLCALIAGGTASAQTAPQPDEYGELMRRATEGARVIDDGEVRPERPASKPRQSRPKLPPRETRQSESSDAERLHDPSEYASEPHRVTVVDRSRYASAFIPTDVPNTLGLQQGSILIDVTARQLYFATSPTMLRRYGVAVGRSGKAWHGSAVVGRMARWPDWRPTANIRRENRRLKSVVRGGASNPLGARAIYLYVDGRDTLYRIHGTNAPSSIGTFASHGCIRMINEDVIELYSMVRPGASVIVR